MMLAFRRIAFFAFVIVLVACGARTPLDATDLGPIGAAAGLRLIAPLSTATVTTQRPTLHWILGPGKDGAQLDICSDRACSGEVTTFTALGTHGVPPADLAPGVHFWRARSTSGGKIGEVASPVWEFWVGARSAPVDTSWGTTLDVNGDGFPDLAVGAPVADSMVGKAYVYHGGASGYASTPTTTLTGEAIPEAPDQGFFGTSVASAGDLNGDGYGDFVVGAVSDGKGEPLAYVFLGGPSGISTPQIVISDHGEGAFTSSVAAAGDVNGDGFGDLIVGELTDFQTTAAAWVYFGSADGLAMSSAAELAGPTVPNGVDGPIVASAGDVNGDGFADVFVGGAYFIGFTGSAMLYLGGASGPSATPLTTLSGPSGATLNYASTPPCAADLDGDGFADLVLRGTTDGTAFVYAGGASGLPSTPTTVLAANTSDKDGWAVSLAAGDVDGDGFVDLLVGSNGFSSETGGVFVYPGGASGVASTPSATVVGPEGQFEFFGSSVASADVNADGFADVVVGAFGFGQHDGRAYLYTSAASGVAAAPTMIFAAPDGGEYGTSVE